MLSSVDLMDFCDFAERTRGRQDVSVSAVVLVEVVL
jgi:hypothetical protein